MSIEATIQRLTNNGEILAEFLVDIVQGNTQHATVSHRLKSVEWLAKLGGFIPETTNIPSKTKNSAPARLCANKTDSKPPVTEKQILHFEIARLIKQETQDGKTAIDFLARVVAKDERPKSGEHFTVAARMRATRELLIRGFGASAACTPRRILSGATEELGSDLAKRIRGCANDGAELVHLLVNAMENKNPEAASKGAQNPYPKFDRQRKTKPAEGFTASQRVWAACELLRRAYDIRTDHITPADIQAYRNAQRPADKAASAAKSEKRPAAIKEKPDDDKQPAVAKNIADKEKPDDDNTPSDTPDRAARRRQKRDARKAEKRAAGEQPAAAENIAVSEKTDDEKRNAANTPFANPILGIHATDINENTVVFSHEPISPEELTRLRKSLAQPDNIPPNARSP